jgi:hypothetical protein
MAEDEIKLDWSERLAKLLPFKVVLNKSETKCMEASEEIARQLKTELHNLQGAFFDVYASQVNYASLKRSPSYQEYQKLAQKLKFFDPFLLKSDEEKKAFWINIYNILIIHGVIELNINDSTKEVFNFFKRIVYNIGGRLYAPDDVEHGILRSNLPHPLYKIRRFRFFDKRRRLMVQKFDPRIHFALVCAASSCPPIEFYDAVQIDEQLDIAAQSFVNRNGLILDKKNNILRLSQIFKWYAPDFGRSGQEVIDYALQFAQQDLREYIQVNAGKLKLEYLPYKWNLNKLEV